ncbi:MAG: peptidylprolyl isomerase [Bacteroidales bacterium]|nr:peptidylprolyl isomerase [Bacteroidales bacterium]
MKNTGILTFIIALMVLSCSRPTFKAKWTTETAPDVFTARFETSKGNFDVEIHRAWSPKAADRFYQLVRHHFYDNMLFYRVVPNFVVQFGNSDTATFKHWEKYKVPDEEVIKSNLKGTMSFARDGKETRGNDLFINLQDNVRLDTIMYNGVRGFPVFGVVTKGMDVVESIYSGYGDETMSKLDTLYLNRAHFLKTFPKLDSIKKAFILTTE